MSHCRIHPTVPPPDAELLRRLAAVPTAAISDSLGRGYGIPGPLPVPGSLRGGRMSGAALTVRTRPGDNLVVHKALDLAAAGDVVVIDAGGHLDRSVIGDLVCRYAKSRGVAGLVVDGAIRDADDIGAGDLPVFTRGVTHVGPYKDGPGEIGGTVSMAGTPVRAGDLVVGDGDGVVVVPRERAEAVATAAEAVVVSEQASMKAIAEGAWDRSWVDAALDIEHVDSP